MEEANMSDITVVEDVIEAKLLEGVTHPGIVKLYTYAIRLGGQSAAPSVWAPGSSNKQCHTLETWLLLEYCDKGTLQAFFCDSISS